jgi:hypothetical protein
MLGARRNHQFAVLLSASLVSVSAFSGDDLAAITERLEQQQQLIEQQQQALAELQQQLADLKRAQGSPPVPVSETQAIQASAGRQPLAKVERHPALEVERDKVGDLNPSVLKTGSFPGSIFISGSKGDSSLAIGGFIKSVVLYDTKEEQQGADMLPSSFGARSLSDEGGIAVDSTISRFYLDGRSESDKGNVRGYFEWDLNKANNGQNELKVRHAFGSWAIDTGTLTAGQTWSTFMDLKVIPEGLTEPTVSGPIFVRQGQIRWSQSLTDNLSYDVALEDPNSNDVFTDAPSPNNATMPDRIAALELAEPGVGHLRLGLLARQLEVAPDAVNAEYEKANGWGAALSGHLDVLGTDKLMLSAAYGKGIGRYLLGIDPQAAGSFSPDSNQIELQDSWGLMSAYSHAWNDTWRSNVMFGHAETDAPEWALGSSFKATDYAAVNLMWQALPYLTIGAEYGYGVREDVSGQQRNNQRIGLGFQFF